MGLSSSQAQMLSITSRMSDNELRAQLISNSKMRLAGQSGQVSENYINALNDAQMMFTNYGADNSSNNQQLTFNALTSYNQYNNQYGLSNQAGQILVSEKDASAFKAAQNSATPLTEFLKSYGLEESTTYFENLNQNIKADGTVAYNESDPISGAIIPVSTGFTPEELKRIYLGETTATDVANGINHLGYQRSLESTEVYKYNKLLENYDTSYENYTKLLKPAMKDYMSGLTTTIGGSNISMTNITNEMSKTGSTADFKQYLSAFEQMLTETKNKSSNGKPIVNNGTLNEYYNSMIESIRHFKTNTSASSVDWENADKKAIAVDKYQYDSVGDLVVADNYLQIEKNTVGGGYNANIITQPGAEAVVPTSTTYVPASGTSKQKFILTFADNYTVEYEFDDWTTTQTDKPAVSEHNISADPTNEDYQKFLSSIVTSYMADGKDQFSLIGFYALQGNSTSDTLKDARKAYETASQELASFEFGMDFTQGNASLLPEEYFQNLTNVDWIISKAAHPGLEYSKEFQVILDIDVLEKVFDTYGEPLYTWIDTNNSNENGETKANWYTNLFNRMVEGYKPILDGLARSPEWIKFALESGMLTMEQVDKTNTWTSFTYANCSDITEQTNDLAITKAEAEYKSEMNKIENKDKRYDMELKNIDTEHSALQTEYDSIKAVIDKNIERSFKMYS